MDFKQQLESLRKQNTISKHPEQSMDEIEMYWGYQWAVKKPKKAGDLEKLIQEYLTLIGFQCSNIKTTGTFIQDKKQVIDVVGFVRTVDNSKWVKGNSTTGVADLVATIYGLKLDIEIKFSKGDSQKDSQIKYEKAVIGANGIYIIVKTGDDFLEQFNDFLDLPQVKLMKEFSINNK